MGLVHAVPFHRRPIERLAPVIGADRYARLRSAADDFRTRFAGRTIWNVNSTAVGGGVAEMLHALVGYVADLGITIRWLVIHGDADFFSITKQVHNAIHGHGDGTTLGRAKSRHYSQILAANAVGLLEWVHPGDIVLLHDPQTAGLAAPLAEAGALVVWRSHIGVDASNDVTEAAWAFLRPYVAEEVLERALWIDPGLVSVDVDEGVVTLAGRLDRRSTAVIAVRLAEAVPGVVDLVDKLEYAHDDTGRAKRGAAGGRQ